MLRSHTFFNYCYFLLLQYLQHYTKEGRKYMISMKLNICLHNIIVIDLVIIPTPRNQLNIKTELQSEGTCLVHIVTTYWKSASGTCTMNKADLSIAEAGDSRFEDGRNRRAGLAIRQILRNTRAACSCCLTWASFWELWYWADIPDYFYLMKLDTFSPSFCMFSIIFTAALYGIPVWVLVWCVCFFY